MLKTNRFAGPSGLFLTSAIVAMTLTTPARAEASGKEIWRIEAGQPAPAGVEILVNGEPRDTLLVPMYQDPEAGPMGMTLVSELPAGVYALDMTYINPLNPENLTARAVTIEVRVDDKEFPKFETYWFDDPDARRTYTYPFRVDTTARHRIYVGLAPLTRIYLPRFAPTLELVSLALRQVPVTMPEPTMKGRPYLDLWGWMACIDYQREAPATLEHLIDKTVKEPFKWGANMMQAYPHFNRAQWMKAWGREKIEKFIIACHEHGMLVDEHMGSDPWSADRAIELIERWGRDNGNLLAFGFDTVVDTWEVEAIGYAIVKAGEKMLEKVITMHDTLWTFNPGTPFNQCDQRPNVWQGGGGGWDCVSIYRGPNLVKTVMCANWCEMVNRRAMPVLSYIDMNPLRVFPGDLGMNNGNRDLFIGYQADSRMFSYAPKGIFGSVFGGATSSDLILRQTDDMFRPRVMKPDEVHESAIWWLGETPKVLPPVLRDSVYAASMDPVRHAFTAKLAATAYNGGIPSRRQTIKETHDEEPYCPWWPRANEIHPATTAFIQNNYLRLLRYANGDFGILEYDPQHTAHFDSNSLAVTLGSAMSTLPESDGVALIREPMPAPITKNVTALTATAMLMLTFDEVSDAATLEVLAAGQTQGRIRVAPGVHSLPIDFGQPGEHKVAIKTVFGPAPVVSALTLRPVDTVQGEPLFALEAGDVKVEAARVEIDLSEPGEKVLPPALTVVDPEAPEGTVTTAGSVHITADGPEGNFVLELAARATDGDARVRVYRDGWRAVHKDLQKKPVVYDFGTCGYLDLPAASADDNPAVVTLPIDFNFAGEHTLELKVVEGTIELKRVRLLPAPVQHCWIERGGHRAVLDETVTRANDSGEPVRETRRYTIDNDCPWLRVDLTRERSGTDWSYSINARGYDTFVNNNAAMPAPVSTPPGNVIRFQDSAGVRPDLIVLLPDHALFEKIVWDAETGQARLSFKADVDAATLYYVAPDVYSENELMRLVRVVSIPLAELHVTDPGNSVAVRNRYDFPVTRTFVINNPKPGPYFVNEQGWWFVRGAQPSREKPYFEFLKINAEPDSQPLIQAYGYIDDVVRPGWGCQNLVAVKDIAADEDGASCTARVMSATAYIFAPRVEFAQPFTNVRINGQPWPYFEDRFVFLPTRAGTYEVAVDNALPLRPRLICTSGMLHEGRWDETANTLTLKIGVQPWTTKIPEAQDYYATILREGYTVESIEGATTADLEPFKVKPEDLAVMTERGLTVRFTPATPAQPDAGQITLQFAPPNEVE